MRPIRTALSLGVLVALAAGYFGSQWFALSGRAPEWTTLIDVPAVAWLALLVFAGAIVLWLLPEREEKT